MPYIDDPNLLERFARGFVGGLGIVIFFAILVLVWFIVRKFYEKIYEKIYKKPYWTKERTEKVNLEKEKADILQNKEKIAEKNAKKKISESGVDLNKNWQEYYKIRLEEMEKFDKRINEIDERVKDINQIIKMDKKK